MEHAFDFDFDFDSLAFRVKDEQDCFGFVRIYDPRKRDARSDGESLT